MADTVDLKRLTTELEQAQEASNTTAQEASTTVGHVVQTWSPELVKFLSVSLLFFTLAALVICAVLLWRSKASGFHVLRVIGVITIIGLSALLLVVGYSSDQLTPIIGLFGAIAGYLLGKDKESSSPALATAPDPTPKPGI